VSEGDSGSDPFGLLGRRAVVTGGTNGIGAAVAALLVARGASVCVLDVEPCAGASVQVDLCDPMAVVAAAGTAVSMLGGVDILVNVAGIAYVADVRDIDLASYHRVLSVNLHAPVLLMRELSPQMVAGGFGRIVNVTSVHSHLSEPGCLTYDASKGALEAATRAAAIDLARTGVLVNAVAPGFVATRMSIVDGVDELASDWFRTVYVESGQLPLGRAGQPGEIAEAVAFLASGLNGYITGAVLTADGGLCSRL
jgi:NAD(P)-dependent dehydrogenase (short-subunit alcohol dehydrogenase family)